VASILGLDIGDVRIGVALADASAPFPAPLTTLEASAELASDFAKLLHTHKVQKVIIGYPRNMSGEPTEQTARVEHIATLLNIPSDIQVVWQDESLTSVKAEEELNRRKKPFNKGDIDALAATYILNDFVMSGAHSLPAPVSVDASQMITLKPTEKAPKKTTKKDHSPKKPAHKKPKDKKHRPKKPFTVLLLIVGFFIAIFISCVVWYTNATGPRTADDVYQVITVEKGMTTKAIAATLQSSKVIRSATAFVIYTRLNGVTNLQAGSYRLSSGDSVSQIVSVIAGGKISATKVLISPGLRLDQILTTLEKEGYTKEQLDSALAAVRDHPLLKDYPESARLEGYLYPDTYQIAPNTSAETLIRTILTNFNSAITPDIRDGIAKQGLTLKQAIIVASVVQKEVSDPKVQPTVAQVFLKRLREGTVMGSDVTYKYAAKQFGTPDDPSAISPYNTRKFVGLPPTAIANFNLSALKAVAFPSSTDYTYFVAGDNGKTYFSSTLEEHQANIDKYCIKGCQ